MNSESFKATISLQLKDKTSDIHCLVHNFYGNDFSFYSSEFQVRILMRWEAFIYHGRTDVVRGYQLSFDKEKNNEMIDLSDAAILKEEFLEEVVELCGSEIALGLRRFRLEHTDYTFSKIYEEGILHPQKFDMKTFKSESVNLTDGHEQWHKEKHKTIVTTGNGHHKNQSIWYLNYRFDHNQAIKLEAFLKTNNLNEKEIKDILSAFIMGARGGTSPLIGVHRAFLYYCKTNKK